MKDCGGSLRILNIRVLRLIKASVGDSTVFFTRSMFTLIVLRIAFTFKLPQLSIRWRFNVVVLFSLAAGYASVHIRLWSPKIRSPLPETIFEQTCRV